MAVMTITPEQARALQKIAKTPLIFDMDMKRFKFFNGEKIHQRVANNLKAKGLISPAGDGLLPGFSQTWRVKRKWECLNRNK